MDRAAGAAALLRAEAQSGRATPQRYGAAPEQPVCASVHVLVGKHLVLGWRRKRFISVLSRSAVTLFLPLLIWFQQPPDSLESVRTQVCQTLLPLVGVVLILLVFTQFVIEVVTDKELKMRYVQQVAGVSSSSYWLSYYVYYFIMTTLCLAVYLLCVQGIATFYKYSSGLLVFLSLAVAFLQTFFLAMMVSTVFARARMAAVVCGMIGALIVVFSQVVLPQIKSTGLAAYFVESLIPFVAPLNLLKAIGLLEATCPGASKSSRCPHAQHPPGFTWDSWSTPITGRDSQTGLDQALPPAGTQLLIMLVGCVIHGLFAVWFDQVYQGEFGAALPWNFFLRPAYMCLRHGTSTDGVQAELENPEPALVLDRLVKTFGEHRAVDGMSLEVHRGEIFALLGHNGAGKTTAINCITGMLPITSGDVRVCGVDVSTQLREARRHLSVCPQDNPLYLELTVAEHLSFFAALRGVPSLQAQSEIEDAMAALGLSEKRGARVGTLSGGQKRRLWVATSILGSTPVVFLDEPTSGMDPANRRKLWDLLVEMKDQGRTILFTTHYLDEADVLAQRKAVLDQGKVRAVGTSWDLKRQFGVGYHLKVICKPSVLPAVREALTALIQMHVPGAALEVERQDQREHGQEANRLQRFLLPYAEVDKFGNLFQDLDSRAAEFEVCDYIVEATSLEEVFMALGQSEADAAVADGSQVAIQVPLNFDPSMPVEIIHPQTGSTVRLTLPAGVQPGETCTVAVPRATETIALASPSMRAPVTWAASASAVVALRWRQVLQKKRSLAATFVVPFLLLGWNAYSTASMLHQISGGDGSSDSAKQSQGIAGASLGMTMTVSMAIALPYFATALVVDRVQRCTYVATSQGLPLSAFWVGTLLSNYIHFLVLALVVPLGLVVFDAPFYGEPEQLARALPGVLWAPVPMLLFAYSSSRLFQSAEACSKFMPGISLLASVLPFLGVYIMTLLNVMSQFGALQCSTDPDGRHCKQMLDFGKTMHTWANALHWVMSFVDPFYLLPGTFAAIGLSLIPEDPFPGSGIKIDVRFPTLAGSAVAVPMIGGLVLSALLGASLSWDSSLAFLDVFARRRGRGRQAADTRAFEAELAEPDVAQVVDTQEAGSPLGSQAVPYVDRDSGVVEEEARVNTADPGSQAVMYQGLVHTYNRGTQQEVRAVRGISLAVPRGECFTLLGPNGAGKTTTLDVLTGAICPPTAGSVTISGHTVTGDTSTRLKALKSLGTCPQVDPLWPSLTGRQHLLFYARVKGSPAHLQVQQTDSLLRALGFSSFDADKPTQSYSGGMKRKLSLAIALIGSPPTLLLDEPSAAVDAAAKRHLWQVVRQRESSQTVILTTHSMEEAEALSDRLAIQVRGKLRCVGTPDYIKNTYGAGYQLELLVDASALEQTQEDVESFVSDLCPEAMLLERQEGRYIFQLPVLKAVGAGPGQVSVATLFRRMEVARSTIGLRDYSISRPSLEQVFLRFSREQDSHP